tara:strand:+ start:1987 stop:2121 length:135 start_codon:yes stop_codon:yes gene_type:complete
MNLRPPSDECVHPSSMVWTLEKKRLAKLAVVIGVLVAFILRSLG